MQSTYSDIVLYDPSGNILQTLTMCVDINGDVLSVTLPNSSTNVLIPTSQGTKASWQGYDLAGNPRDTYTHDHTSNYYDNVYITGTNSFDLSGILLSSLGSDMDAIAISLYNTNSFRMGDAKIGDSLYYFISDGGGIADITMYDGSVDANSVIQFSYAGYSVTVTDNASCFCEDTQILCADGTTQPIQCLTPGTLIQTLTSGPKKVVTIGKRTLVHNKVCTYEKFDLRLTDKHGILVDRLTYKQEQQIKETYGAVKKIEGKFVLPVGLDGRVSSTSISINIPVYHIVLESEDGGEAFGVCANTRWVESCSANDYLKYSGMVAINV